MFEVAEGEEVIDRGHLRAILREYGKQGFKTAIDDFGAGFSGLALLAEFQPDIIKLDMGMVRNVDEDVVRATIVKGVVDTARALGIEIIAEGIETEAELGSLQQMGIHLFQGYLFAKPAFEALPDVPRLSASPQHA
jgi:EAL domain-containing protein (putative c-di-GMP-specific phosphodiesterase class I)